jgi:hypothetical protein
VLFLTKDEFVHELGMAKEKLSFLIINTMLGHGFI